MIHTDLSRVRGMGQFAEIGSALSSIVSSPIGNMLLNLGTQVASAEISAALAPTPGTTGQAQGQPVLPGTVPNAGGNTYNVYVAPGSQPGAGASSFDPVAWWNSQDQQTQIAIAAAGGLLLYALLR